MFTNAKMPHVHVRVNGVLDACLKDCSYEFQIVIPQVISQSVHSNKVSIGISDPGNANY